jgi:hypothetical protein
MAILKNLRIDEVSCVVKGANPGAKVMIRKNDDWARDAPLLFNDIMRKADVSDPLRGDREEPDDKKLSAKLDELVNEMIVARPSLHPNRARRWLLETPHGRELLAQHTKKEEPMPQIDILKVIAVVEDGMMANVRLNKRDNETDAQAFTRIFNNDIEMQKTCVIIRDAKLALATKAMSKAMPTLTPTSTDDSDEAVRLLQEMAAKNGKSFEAVFSAPENRALAARTYTNAHRSSSPYSAGSE